MANQNRKYTTNNDAGRPFLPVGAEWLRSLFARARWQGVENDNARAMMRASIFTSADTFYSSGMAAPSTKK